MNPEDTAGNGSLSPRQSQFVIALLTAPTIAHACKAAGVPERTAFKWLADPIFVDAYRGAKRDALGHATGRLAVLADAAVATLQAILVDVTAPAAVRLAAAKVVLDAALKVADLDDTQARIAALEQAAEGPRLLHHAGWSGSGGAVRIGGRRSPGGAVSGRRDRCPAQPDPAGHGRGAARAP